MARSISAKKRVRQNETHREHNRSILSRLRTQIKKVKDLAGQGNVEAARKELGVAYRLLDRAASKHIIHRNAAARQKSRLTLRVTAAKPGGAAPAKPAATTPQA